MQDAAYLLAELMFRLQRERDFMRGVASSDLVTPFGAEFVQQRVIDLESFLKEAAKTLENV